MGHFGVTVASGDLHTISAESTPLAVIEEIIMIAPLLGIINFKMMGENMMKLKLLSRSLFVAYVCVSYEADYLLAELTSERSNRVAVQLVSKLVR